MVFLSQEEMMVKYIKDHLEVNLINMVKEDKLTEPLVPLIELVMLCYTHYLVDH